MRFLHELNLDLETLGLWQILSLITTYFWTDNFNKINSHYCGLHRQFRPAPRYFRLFVGSSEQYRLLEFRLHLFHQIDAFWGFQKQGVRLGLTFELNLVSLESTLIPYKTQKSIKNPFALIVSDSAKNAASSSVFNSTFASSSLLISGWALTFGFC